MVWYIQNGIDVIDVHTLGIQHISPAELGIEEASPYALFKDSKGRFWMGTGRGLYLKGTGYRFAKISVLPDFFTQDIAEDKNGNIWIATMGNGVYMFNPKTGRSVHFEYISGKIALVPIV